MSNETEAPSAVPTSEPNPWTDEDKRAALDALMPTGVVGHTCHDEEVDVVLTALAPRLVERERAAKAEVEMYRTKAEDARRSRNSFEAAYARLANGLCLAILRDETATVRTGGGVPTAHLRFLLGDDEPVASQDLTVLRDAMSEYEDRHFERGER